MILKEKGVWEEIKANNPVGKSPSRRYGHTAVLHEDSMFVFGGYDCDSFICSDLWAFSFSTYTADLSHCTFLLLMADGGITETLEWNRVIPKQEKSSTRKISAHCCHCPPPNVSIIPVKLFYLLMLPNLNATL